RVGPAQRRGEAGCGARASAVGRRRGARTIARPARDRRAGADQPRAPRVRRSLGRFNRRRRRDPERRMTRRAAVTGAGSGIGKACAEELGRRRLEVVCIGRRKRPLDQTVATICARGGSAVAAPADITTDEGIRTVTDMLAPASLAALVHAAGRDSVTAFGDTLRAELDAVVATNLSGPFLLTQALVDK